MKTLRRFLFVVLIVPFTFVLIPVLTVITILSGIYWIFTGRSLFFVIDWITKTIRNYYKSCL